MSSVFSTKKVSGNLTDDSFDDSTSAIPVDVYRKKDKLIIVAPIAGVTIEDITVSITDDILTIKGVRHAHDESSSEDYFSSECFWGEFSRSIVLPVNVNPDKVAAFYKRGILRIEMPITDEDQTRVIPVTIESE